MKRINSIIFALAAAALFAACGAPANNSPAANSVAKPAVPLKEALMTLERSAYEAWKTRDAKFWDTFLDEKFVGYGTSGRLDKASAAKEYTGADCEVRSYALSDEQMRPLGKHASLLTHKVTVDATCAGQKVPADSWVASIYVREGDQWKAAFHAEAAIVDPKAAPAATNEAPKRNDVKTASDPNTESLARAEKALWEAWKDHDGKRIEGMTTNDVSFINIFGTFFANKADALKDWTSPGCDVQKVSVTNAAATMLSPHVGILLFDGGADGTCFGQKIGPVWSTSVYLSDGTTWKWTFGINLPAR